MKMIFESTILFPFIAGGIATLAFAPNRVAWLAIVSVAMLFHSLRTASTPRQASLRAYVYGLGLFGFGLYWLQIVVYDHGALPHIVAWLITLLFIAALALLFALQGYCLKRFTDLNRLRVALYVFPLSFVVFEWVRSTLFTGLPWLLLGVSQTDSPLGHFLPYVGVGGTTFIVAFTAVILWYCQQQIGLIHRARFLAAATLLGMHYLIPALPLWAIIAFFIYNLLFLRNHSTWAFTIIVAVYLTAGLAAHQHFVSPQKPLTVSMVQVNVPNRLKWDPTEISNTINKYLTLSDPVWQSDLIIWPEGSIPRLKQEMPNLLFDLKKKAIEHDTTLMLGLPSYDADTGVFHNSLFVIGKEEGEYHKRHLVPFGEYVPLQDWLRGVFSFLDLPMSALESGEKNQQPLQTLETTFAPFICFETAYTQYLANALPQSEVLIAVSDDSWFGESIAGQQHLQIAQALAKVGGRQLLHSTNTGITAVVGVDGKVLKMLAPYRPGVLTAEVSTYQGTTPWVWLNQWPIWSWLANFFFLAMLIYYSKSTNLAIRPPQREHA